MLDIFFYTVILCATPAYTQLPYGGLKTRDRGPFTKRLGWTFESQGKNQHGYLSDCNTTLGEVRNAHLKCTNNFCKVTCVKGYIFPSGATTLSAECKNNTWRIQNSYESEISDCQPLCQPKCENNGICIAPDKCHCPENYFGHLCQNLKQLCLSKPPTPKNARISCNAVSCSVSCAKGYTFPDLSAVTNLNCKNGVWVPSRHDFSEIPDCQPTCKPQCENGGNCVSLNICVCPNDFRGPQCQYSADRCSPKKMGFNGGYNCHGNNEAISCQLNCPKNVEFEFSPSTLYTCEFSKGYFEPRNIPRCVYGEGVQVVESSGSFYQNRENHYDVSEEANDDWELIIKRTLANRKISSHSDFSSSYGSPFIYLLHGIAKQPSTPSSGVCFIWGGSHLKTFDGLLFKFPLQCAYTIVKDRVDHSFNVVMKGCHRENNECQVLLEIYFQEAIYALQYKDGAFLLVTPKKTLPVPVQLMGMKVTRIAQHVKVDLELVGLSILWDGNQYLSIEVKAGLWNRTDGLCGTFDANPKNDISTKEEHAASTIKSFVDSWKATEDKTHCSMEMKDELKSEKECTKDQESDAASFCNTLLEINELQECLSEFDRISLVELCIDEYCSCRNDSHPTTCNCNAMSALIRECQLKGKAIHNDWRNSEICPLICEKNRIYMPCGPANDASCGSAVDLGITAVCNEGCFCPPGTMQHRGDCVPTEECPCRLRNKEFEAGHKVKKDCNTCVCKNGIWACTDISCGARCAAVGDPHYVTFDGKRYNFMGTCSYYLVKTKNVSIEAENVVCSGRISESMNFDPNNEVGMPSCTKSVTIRFKLSDKEYAITLQQGNIISINNKQVKEFPKIIGSRSVIIRQASSIFIIVDFADGLRIWWDGVTRVYVDAPSTYRGRTQGLCGTFNSNIQDDFLTPEGDIEVGVEPFAEKWKAEPCDLNGSENLITHPCQTNFENKNKAEIYCSKLVGDIFEGCHWLVDPTPFFEDCMYDVCACRENAADCFCPIYASYGAECSRQGVITNWRYNTKECEIECPYGQVFDECGDSCQRTCEDLSTRDICRGHCVEGCRCPPGQYLNSKNHCVPEAQCQCYFDGLLFENGYKEVRPGNRFMELCSCSGGQWVCDIANPEDIELYPPAAELKEKCSSKEYAEFSKCLPSHQKTCKNMHAYKEIVEEECKPGCICAEGYVLDTAAHKCVLPENCSCHHGGKSYDDGESFKEECSTCICKAGKWNCVSNKCAATCKVWGDSHFTSFDKADFDFQGVCDYILAKGSLPEGDGFSIVIQNVLCGSMGVTCSKSIKISLNGRVTDSIILSSDYHIPKRKDSPTAGPYGFSVYKSGLLTTIEVTGIGLQLKWDHGTRIYVRLNEQWKGKTRGLCGNYNSNAMDDMMNPSLGLETDPLLFGHSWRLQEFCAPPTKQIDSCAQHLERKSWAHSKCSILKSELFQPCHLAVPVDDYLNRCIFDTCACDRGGDCDCLCTAIATYAYECSTKGIPIPWRTPEFCPMQCDSHCSNYNPCISSCPVETCDDYMELDHVQKMCHAEACIEGCRINKCEEGFIYTNSSYVECVSKNQCRPLCMKKDGKIYYEGDIIHSDDCHTCRCSRKKEICSGAPCAQVTELLQASTEQSFAMESSQCTRGWTDWSNTDTSHKKYEIKTNKANSLKINDVEPLPKFLNILSSFGYGSCSREFMKDIECRVVGSHKLPKEANDNAYCSLQKGLICIGLCHDYEIRVYCDCGEYSTTYETITDHTKMISFCKPNDPFEEIVDDCFKFRYCEQQPDGSWDYGLKTCGPSMMFNPITRNCDWKISVQQNKPICKMLVTQTPRSSTQEDIILVATKEPQKESCNPEIPHIEHPVDCFKFLHCLPTKTGAWGYVEKNCGPTMMFNPRTMVCDWPANVLKIKSQCATINKESMQQNKSLICPDSQILSDCAFPCGRACDFYQKQLHSKLMCTSYSRPCEIGCVNETEKVMCAYGELWRDKKTCVQPSDCPCMSHSGKFVKPNDVFRESECEMCQCLDNSYVCSKSQCAEETEFEHYTLPPVEDIQKEAIPSENLLIVPTVVTPPKTCESRRFVPVINGNTRLPDSSFDASSVLGTSFLPQYARLNGRPTDVASGSWSPLVNDQSQYLQITFERPIPLYGVIMQGSPLFDQYVTNFQILHSFDGVVFHYVVDEGNIPQLFSGPVDPQTAIESVFKTPIEAKVVRIFPVKWHNGISIRLELLGCSGKMAEKLFSDIEFTSSTEPNGLSTAYPKILAEENLHPLCDDPMGMDSGYVSHKQVSASSIKPNFKGEIPNLIDLLRSTSRNGWQPALDSLNEFVMFDFVEFRNITGVRTMGGDHGWVTAYKIFYSNNADTWNPILSQEGSPRIFLANTDDKAYKINYFTQPIRTRYLKLSPVKWAKCIEMKVEPMGCFIPYEEIEEQITRTASVAPIEAVKICPVCTGVSLSIDLPDGSSCKCEPPEFWNGVHCVDRNQCPCFVGHIQYEVGAQYQSENCQQCVCVLGGVQQCKPQKCPKCNEGLRPVKSRNCACVCESCPEFQKLCPTTGDCIPENFWCNGIKDCADDEFNCDFNTTSLDVMETPVDTKNTFENETKKCPDPYCPPGMKIESHRSIRKMSPIFEASAYSYTKSTRSKFKPEGISKNIRKSTYMNSKNKIKGKFHKKAKLPYSYNATDRSEECYEFTCSPVSKAIVSKMLKPVPCPVPVCPPEFYLDKVPNRATNSGECAKYSCLLRPPKDAICSINGRFFKTFDGVEYKYDICNHTLVRNYPQNQWSISIAKNCSEGGFICRKQFTIVSAKPKLVLTLFSDLTVALDGLKFPGRQLEMSPLLGSTFELSQPGNTILLISQFHGFWMSYDTSGTAKIGVSAKMMRNVDGLCGYYDGFQNNDKSLPDGTNSESTIEFGDSWIVGNTSETICKPQACAHDTQKSAWKICATIRDEVFSPCVGALDYDRFMPNCMESTCDCLKMSTGEHDNGAKKCRCSILSSFVQECLTSKPVAEITNWRAIYECEITCLSPSTYIDCYRRKCEPSCENHRLGNCPVLPNVCFSGCYCPEGMVRNGDTCVAVTECLDCACDGFGKSKYMTYDRQNFSIDGKCTYLLTRNTFSNEQNSFEIYVTVGNCPPMGENVLPKNQSKSKQRKSSMTFSRCINSLHIFYNNHTIQLHNKDKFIINIDKKDTGLLPFSTDWLEVNENVERDILVTLQKAGVETAINIVDLSFTIRLPSIKYKSGLVGLCGNCNGDPNDDLKINSNQQGDVEESVENIIQSWRSEKLKFNEIGSCLEEPTLSAQCIRSPAEIDSCQKIMDKSMFGLCHAVVDPSMYISACEDDICKSDLNYVALCDSILAYVKSCFRHGICINWRGPDFCSFKCPSYMNYKSCECIPTCNIIQTTNFYSNGSISDTCITKELEGCACPENQALNGTNCVPKQSCIKCDDGHYFGETWIIDKCKKCTCNENAKIVCMKQECPSVEQVCAEDYLPFEINDPKHCCPKYMCVPRPTMMPSIECSNALIPTCSLDQITKTKTDHYGCIQYYCECKPISECPPATIERKLNEGEVIVNSTVGCCPKFEIKCDKLECPAIPKKCENPFYSIVEKRESSNCCSEFVCEPPKDFCLVSSNGIISQKKIGEKWISSDNACLFHTCGYGPDGLPIISDEKEVCDKICPKGTIYTTKGSKCCGTCVQSMCSYNGDYYKPGAVWSSTDNCTSFRCETNVSDFFIVASEVTCPDISKCSEPDKFNDGCCQKCKLPIDSKQNCIPRKVTEEETIGVIQSYEITRGLCKNKDPIINFTECHGACKSGTKFNPSSQTQDHYCNCCKYENIILLNVTLHCNNGQTTTKQVPVPQTCNCLPCSAENLEVEKDKQNTSSKTKYVKKG